MKEYVSTSTGIYYRINEFQQDQKTLVFIHGLSGNSSAWEPYEQRFMDDYNLLCIDLRGHGCSRKYSKEKDYAIELFINDIGELLDYLKIDKYIVVSHSFGSIISVGLIQRNLDRIKGAIFLAPAFESKYAVSIIIKRIMSGMIAFLLRILPIRGKPGKRIDYSRLIPTSDWDMRRVWIDIKNTGLAIYFFCLHSLYCSVDDISLTQLHLPVLIIHGKKDSYVSLKYSIHASKDIAGSKLVVLPDADHMLIFNYSGEISKIMAEFMASISLLFFIA
jgi:pimeloyl-ACP methyl ester carboxylesterase